MEVSDRGLALPRSQGRLHGRGWDRKTKWELAARGDELGEGAWKGPKKKENMQKPRSSTEQDAFKELKKVLYTWMLKNYERAAQDLATLVLEYLVSHEKECGFILKANGNWSVCLYSLPVCLLRSLWFYYRFKWEIVWKVTSDGRRHENHSQKATSQENRHTAAFNMNFHGKREGSLGFCLLPPFHYIHRRPFSVNFHWWTADAYARVGILRKLKYCCISV